MMCAGPLSKCSIQQRLFNGKSVSKEGVNLLVDQLKRDGRGEVEEEIIEFHTSARLPYLR